MFLGRDCRIKDDKIKNIKKVSRIDYHSKATRLFWGFFFILDIFIAIGEIIVWIEHFQNIMRMAPILGFVTVKFQFLFKLAKLFYDQERITRLFTIVETQFWSPEVEPSIRRKLDFNFDMVNKIIFIFGTGSMVLSLFYACFPVLPPIEGQRQLPYDIWLPFDHSPDGIFHFMYFVMGANGCLIISIIILFDFHFVYFTQHLFAQFETVRAVLENMCTTEETISSEEEELGYINKEEFQAIIEAKLKACIEHYKLLLAFWQDEEKFFSVSLTIQMAFTGLLSIMIGFCTMEEPDMVTALKYFLLFMCICVQMFLYTYHGSELQERTLNVATGAYCSRWYLANRKIQKSLVFFIMGAQNELKLTASGLVDVNNNTFVQIYQTTFSFITLLRSFKEEQD